MGKARRKKEPRGERTRRVPGRLEAEAVAVGLLAVALLLEASLWSYDVRDPWWGFGTSVHNWCGPVGALLASGLAGTIGWAAHVLPLAALAIAARYLGGVQPRPRWIPLVAWSVFWLALSGAFETLHLALPDRVPAAAGGLVGGVLVRGLAGAVYLPGTAVLLGMALCTSLVVATGVSIRDTVAAVRAGAVRLSRRIGRGAGQLVVVAWVRARRRLELARAARAVDAGTARVESDPPPRRLLPRPREPREAGPEVVEHPVELRPAARQAKLPFASDGKRGPYQLPDLDVLAKGVDEGRRFDRELLIRNSQVLEKKLSDFGVSARVVKVHPGPVITMYEVEPAPGIKVSRIVNLADDLALALRAVAIRIVAPIPGKNVVGVEVPNGERETVLLHDLLAHESYQDSDSKLALAMGKDIFGNPVVADLARMPHLLVAGATGTGKSVFLNSLLCGFFFKATPDDVKLLLIDPKLLEFSVYEGIPHLISEVVTDPRRAAAALLGVVHKMEERYKLMAERGVRNIDQYNRAIAKDVAAGVTGPDGEPPVRLPYIVVVIDELADLMIVSARDVEEALTRLAQMARAAGIHLVLATQRPSVDVLTGIIKANFPSRISFQVSSRTDSRTVLDNNGAERLLGMGDMLFLPPGTSKLDRIHGPYISETEVQRITDHLRAQGAPEFDPDIIRLKRESEEREQRGEEFDEMYDQAVDVVANHRIASISFIQRKLKIGYNRAARLMEQMESEGVVGPQEGTKPREIFVRPIDA